MTQTLTADTRAVSALPAARRSPDGKGAPGAPSRDAFFDNAKLLAIVLVLVGHAWEPLTDSSRTARALYMLVYTFHMPAFIIVSGYFSRSFDDRPDRLRRLVTGIVVPYLVFETAFSLFKRYADDDPGHPVSLTDPWYLTWFLLALLIWRLTAPLWRILRYPLPMALVVATLASISNLGEDLDLQRVLQFLPFFVVGLCLRPEHFRLVRKREVRFAAVPVLLCALAFVYWAAPRMTRSWLYHRDSAQDLGVSPWVAAVMTLALFICSMVLVCAFFSLVPGRRLWITTLGTGTLYAFLLHGFLAKGSRFWGWYDHDFVHTPLGGMVVTVIATVIALALCTAPVRWIFRPVLEPRMEWLFRGGRMGGRSTRRKRTRLRDRFSKPARTTHSYPARRSTPPT